MKLFTNISLSGIALGLFVNVAQADGESCQSFSESWELRNCWYLGVGLNISDLKPDSSKTSWEVTDDSDQGFSLHLGVNLTHHVFTELSYSDLGESTLESRNPFITNKEFISYKVPALWLGYYLRGYEESRDWDIYVKVGVGGITNDSSSELLPYKEQTSWQLALAVGAEYKLSEHWDARLSFFSFDEDARGVGLSLTRDLVF
ncbi:porin family protein [Ketobacter sp. MCCC 1A13808]|uniref:porin family protein n=1 Tax=Ketobacter sp. MCCC 1A13808 TaxID=2602738 RepID=UPI000F12DA5F|nr:porin family protein [Ketobacter sp. MCCC 1A13808]MVF13199.1 porin family protein [Ketobacter sp. MCCC 1A13808]RLP54197.1 MAG: porin family protein [Ketobacter sp.]